MSAPCFRVLATFRHGENVYLQDYIYAADRPHLIRLVEEWLAAGQVQWVEPDKRAAIGGHGAVQ